MHYVRAKIFKGENMMEFHAQGVTDRGRIRPTNQDSYLLDSAQNLFIVADGMGGHAGGEIASHLCVDHVLNYVTQKFAERASKPGLNSEPDLDVVTFLASAINFASVKIYEKALEEPGLKGMGTTATVLKFDTNYAYIAHVGDSRLYLIRCGFIYQITLDHSLVSEQVRAGILTAAEAAQHHLKNVITRSVGFQEEEDVDTFSLALEENDIFLLCSDGLHGKITDIDIARICYEDLPNAAIKLTHLANENGGDDNITTLIVVVSKK